MQDVQTIDVLEAIEANSHETWRLIGQYTPDLVITDIRGATLMAYPLPHPLFNAVLEADIEPGQVDDAIDAVCAFFGERAMPWNWTVWPKAKPADLGEHLLRRGFTLSYEMPGMAKDLRAYEPRPLDNCVREASDAASFDLWNRAVVRAFGLMPEAAEFFGGMSPLAGQPGAPIRCFSAFDGDQVVSVGMVCYVAGVAGLYCIGTMPEARRRGFGEKIMHACLSAAVEDGYDTAILHSSRMGLPMYEKLGFEERFKVAYYNPPVDSSQR
jgi:ribosomal protein S18 acetylase RimI-like enzyme